MPKITFTGLKELNKEFKNMSKQLKSLDTKILEEVSGDAFDALSKSFSIYNGIDDNLIGNTEFEIKGKELQVSQNGDQVAFIEFGTGYEGAKNPHPQASENNWKYAVGKKIRYSLSHNTNGWYYNKNGDRIFTTGIAAQRPALDASDKIEKLTLEYADKLISEVIGNG